MKYGCQIWRNTGQLFSAKDNKKKQILENKNAV